MIRNDPSADADGTDLNIHCLLPSAYCLLPSAFCSLLLLSALRHLFEFDGAVTDGEFEGRAAAPGPRANRVGRNAVAFARLKVCSIYRNRPKAQHRRVDVRAEAGHQFYVQFAGGHLYLRAQTMPAARRNSEINVSTLNQHGHQ